MRPLQTEVLYHILLAHIANIANPRRYIQEELSPLMDAHRGRTGPMSFSAVIQKIFSTDPAKPGEAVEWIKARRQPGLEAVTTLEKIDMLYYLLQPSMSIYVGPLDQSEEAEATAWVERFTHLPARVAYGLCILKYLTRIHLTSPLPKAQRDNIETIMKNNFILEPAIWTAITDFWQDYELHDQERERQRVANELGEAAMREIEIICDQVMEDPEIREKAARLSARVSPPAA